MAPLSRQLCGLLLPHDRYGSHLDASRHTVDETLERKNFQYAGEALAEVWSNTIIDKFPVVAEYVKPTGRGKYQNARFHVYVNIFLFCAKDGLLKKSRFSLLQTMSMKTASSHWLTGLWTTFGSLSICCRLLSAAIQYAAIHFGAICSLCCRRASCRRQSESSTNRTGSWR